jgi:hypothetical protein
MMKKEEEVEKIEEEFVTLKFIVFNLSTNIDETKTSTSVVENEHKHSRFSENNNEEKRKSYAKLLKGRNHGQPESKKNDKYTSSRRPSTFKQQRSFNHNEGIHRREYNDHSR